MATKKVWQQIFFSPLSFIAVFGSWIRNPGWVKIRIRDPWSGIIIPDPQHCLSSYSKKNSKNIQNTVNLLSSYTGIHSNAFLNWSKITSIISDFVRKTITVVQVNEKYTTCKRKILSNHNIKRCFSFTRNIQRSWSCSSGTVPVSTKSIWLKLFPHLP
jgi:hypothetical protein